MSLLETSEKIKRSIAAVSKEEAEIVSRSSIKAYKAKVTTAPAQEAGSTRYRCGVTLIGDETEISVLCPPRMVSSQVGDIVWVQVLYSNWKNAVLWQKYDFSTDSDIPAISQTQNNGVATVPSDNLLLKSSFARVYRSLSELSEITTSSTMLDVMLAMDNGGSYLIADISGYTNLYPVSTNYQFGVLEIIKLNVNRASAKYTALNSAPSTFGTVTRMWYGEFQTAATGYEWSGWKEVINA